MKKVGIILLLILSLTGCKDKDKVTMGIDVDSVGSKTQEELESKYQDYLQRMESEDAENESLYQESLENAK